MPTTKRKYNLHDALSMLEDEGIDFSGANIFTVPPDTDLSDGDSEDEDEGGDLNRLAPKLLKAEASVTLHHENGRSTLETHGTLSDEEPGPSSRQQDPMPSSSKPEETKRWNPPKDRNWKKTDTPWIKKKAYEWNEQTEPKFLSLGLNPVEFVELFLDDDIIGTLCDNSMAYATENGRDFHIDREEFRAFLGILWLSGYNGPPRRRLFWAQEEDVRNPLVCSAMDRDRFETIFRNLHVSSGPPKENDKFSKVRPLINHLNEKCLTYFIPHENLSVDESMVPYYGRHGCKQFIRGKPIRYGYKLWCLATPEGYLIQFEPYQGAGTGRQVAGLGMGGSVVVDLMSELPAELPFHVTCDNLFTSVKLIDFMSEKGWGITGTLRKNRTEKCPLTETGFGKTKRGTYEYFHDINNHATVCHWNDNNIVIVASNASSVFPIYTAQRWSSAENNRISVTQPNMIRHYNQTMGSVDRMDQNISKYRIALRMKKWWWALFAFLMDVAIHQGWQLYRKSGQETLDFLTFRRYVVRTYLQRFAVIRTHTGRPISRGKSEKEDHRVPPALRFDRLDHIVSTSEKQLRCGECHKKTRRKCLKCNRGLHEWCFARYHEKNLV